MNKGDLIDKLADSADISKKQSKMALEALLDTVSAALKKGDRVTLTGFGTFSISARAARTGRNPQSGAPLMIKAMRVPKFKAGKELSAKI